MGPSDNRRACDREDLLAKLPRHLFAKNRRGDQHQQAEQPDDENLRTAMLATAEAKCEQAGGHDKEQHRIVEAFVFQESRSQRWRQGNGNRSEQAMDHTDQR